MDYRIGLDIGIASVGWAVLENNSQDEPVRIVDLGVRIFDKAEIPKTGDPLAGPRRDARSARRRLRRRKHRLERIKWLLQQEGMIEIDRFMERYKSANLPDVYQLRYEGLDRKLSDDEFAQVLLHIAKHRGFRSTSKSELNDKKKEKENGAVLKATKENKARMEAKGYRTVGEMIYCDEEFRTSCPWTEKGYVLSPRNKAENYRHTILRDLLEEEVRTIFADQRACENARATEELEQEYLKIMLNQRSFDMGPGPQADGTPSPYAMEGFGDRVGKCTLEPEETRAAKATYTAELFVALQKINHIRMVNKNGESRSLTPEERQLLIELLRTQKEIKYAAVRKKLNIDTAYKFNTLNYSSRGNKKDEPTSEDDKIKNTENTKFISMPNYHEVMKRIGHVIETMSDEEAEQLLDNIGDILTLFKNDDSRTTRLQELGLSQSDIDALLELSPAKFQHLSLKAMRKIMPYLLKGKIYNEACEAAGYDFKADSTEDRLKILKGERITEIINDITNPVVKRSVSQTVKVLNAIIQKYGSPQAVNIELSREMAKNFDERKKLKKSIDERQGENERIKKEIQSLGVISPTGLDIIKYRLWQEQQGYCLYSGKLIPLTELFRPGYDIDHILPYSITFDDSLRNKVLVTAQENRQKGNRTPYEYMGNDEQRWKEFEARVNWLIRDYKKQQKLLKKHFTEEERKQFKERNLTDTKYITTVVYNLIRQNLEFAPFNRPDKKKHVMAVNGTITAYLRKRWGLAAKDRSTDTHHARDAVVVACCTDGMIQKISRNVQAREILYTNGGSMFDEELGVCVYRDNMTRDEWDKMYGVKIAKPWNHFTDELEIRMGDDPKAFLDTHSDMFIELDYPEEIYKEIHPIFVSRMPNHKVTGAAHADTVRSPRHFKDGGAVFENGGYVVTRTNLTDLKLNKDGEIDGYYNKESDVLLYEALKRQLLLYSNDAKKAFAEPFHKPKADGTPGPVVKKVKICKKLSSGVYVNGGKGIAENDSMVRIDVFCENGKYYFVPIYVADVVKKELPNKAAVAYKPYENWKVMEDKDFIFSLYPKDLVRIESNKGVKLNMVSGGQVQSLDVLAYYTGANISTASIAGMAHDSGYKFESLGIQRLKLLEKCQVDILGNIATVKREKRMGFN